MATIQNGIAATSTAARPLGTVNSAQTTAPLPKPSNRTPRSASAGHERGEGSGSPRAATAAMRSAPAAVQRNPAMRKGGIVSSAIRIAVYVVPHTRHTTTQAK
jgi:hypothetical protein